MTCTHKSEIIVGACGSGKNADCNSNYLAKMAAQYGVEIDLPDTRSNYYGAIFCCESELDMAAYGEWFHQGCGFTNGCAHQERMLIVKRLLNIQFPKT
jgi:hypothetical protein